jgi:surface polysaccharide O-acyltransferase-like enzyme
MPKDLPSLQAPPNSPALNGAPGAGTTGLAPHAEPTRAEPIHAEPTRAEPIAAEPIAAEPIAAEPTQAQSIAAQLAYTSYLRVVAIIGVVLIHTAGLTYANDELRYTDAWWVAALATFSTKWAVPTFVMVSGALLLRPPADRSVGLFYRRRLSRIGIPLIVWHVVYITLTATVLVSTPVTPQRLFTRFLRGESYTGLYFFWLILGLYLITPLLWPLVASLSQRALGLVGVLLMATTAVNLSTLRLIRELDSAGIAAGDRTLFTQFVPFIGYFLLGYAMRNVIVRGSGRVLALAFLTLALCLELTWQVTGPFVFGAETARNLNILTPVHYQGWVLSLAAVAVFVLAHSVVHPDSRWAKPRAARWARRAGDLTLGVYATHLAVLFVLQHIPGHHWPSGAKTLTQLVVLSAATLLGALVVTMAIKRIPVLRRCV